MLIIIIWYDISWEKEKVETTLPLKSLHSMSLMCESLKTIKISTTTKTATDILKRRSHLLHELPRDLESDT